MFLLEWALKWPTQFIPSPRISFFKYFYHFIKNLADVRHNLSSVSHVIERYQKESEHEIMRMNKQRLKIIIIYNAKTINNRREKKSKQNINCAIVMSKTKIMTGSGAWCYQGLRGIAEVLQRKQITNKMNIKTKKEWKDKRKVET